MGESFVSAASSNSRGERAAVESKAELEGSSASMANSVRRTCAGVRLVSFATTESERFRYMYSVNTAQLRSSMEAGRSSAGLIAYFCRRPLRLSGTETDVSYLTPLPYSNGPLDRASNQKSGWRQSEFELGPNRVNPASKAPRRQFRGVNSAASIS